MKFFLGLMILPLVGCATASRASLPQAVDLRFKGRAGERTETRYYSIAQITTYEDQQLLRDRQESVDFNVSTHVTAADDKQFSFTTRTTRKDGTVGLHDLSFPELNEQIDYVVQANGEVLHAGNFPPQSLFYVPSMPMPASKVEVGDTWTMAHTWFSSKDAIPLKLDVVGILKDIVPCEKTKVCADVEISGHVGLMAQPTTAGSRFSSRLWGRALFSVERGDVIWSEMRSREEMGVKGDHMNVASCMVSEMKLTAEYHIAFACNPNDEVVKSIPRL